MKKNLIIGPAHPLRGGIANLNESLCKAFNEAGIDSEIVSFSLQYPGFLFPGTTQYATGTAPIKYKITTIINSINPFNWIKAARYIKKQKPDYIIIRYWLPFMAPCLGSIARLVRFNSNIKVIALTDNIIPHEKRFGDRLFTNYFVKSCDAFVAMSTAVIKDLEQFTANTNKRFIPHPIYDTFGEKVDKKTAIAILKLNPDYKYILFFGFIRHYKGLDLLLEAMGDKRIKKLGIKLIIAGEFYESPAPYLKLISKYGLEEYIELHSHYIDRDLVKYYFCASDLIVQPYHSATQSGVTQIAYNFERPMLVTNVGGLAEMVPNHEAGYVIEPDPNEISEAIIDYYFNQREEDFTKRCAIEKKRFSWSNMVTRIESLYNSVNR